MSENFLSQVVLIWNCAAGTNWILYILMAMPTSITLALQQPLLAAFSKAGAIVSALFHNRTGIVQSLSRHWESPALRH